jgi:hypothetical protein
MYDFCHFVERAYAFGRSSIDPFQDDELDARGGSVLDQMQEGYRLCTMQSRGLCSSWKTTG